ncbi:Hypothetical predicted protein [Olea europaea subsp. europaea]|uniref:Uncharacterized protein n=1 Tax=Olea europaea subsp. europaea TaxID=158383 RepID=A0A8S0RLL4_OLEEU|nr:Hypothetical predicted protein [Olea europaea subsp. europaea]
MANANHRVPTMMGDDRHYVDDVREEWINSTTQEATRRLRSGVPVKAKRERETWSRPQPRARTRKEYPNCEMGIM